MQQETITLIVAGLGIAGTLFGTLTGHFLTRSWQQKQWMQDRRKEEFRELQTVLVKAFGKYGDARYQLRPVTEEDIFEMGDTSALCYQTFCDRIYIADDVRRLNLIQQWSDALAEFNKTNSPESFGTALRRMTSAIAEAATKNP